jgi:type I site-specific restriction-modification system R (restriction) subunit
VRTSTPSDSLPNGFFIGFIGTPIEKTGATTRAVLTPSRHSVSLRNGLYCLFTRLGCSTGDTISTYNNQLAVADKAAVAID